ncbi:type 2 periplasmic-binding domain-containing protein [Spirochaeta lutea]|uniref:Uncharacterized protein n=1 Tax=Spirochaeta lutea TaxID=1480694 RepID=A0A098QX42_9SPIO|nr:hypothetical protein [Spirochaeta lutea]KGE72420.1 hypothetical protein DC28_07085 [Spirochaeta lutea]
MKQFQSRPLTLVVALFGLAIPIGKIPAESLVPSEISAPQWLGQQTLEALAGIPSETPLNEPLLGNEVLSQLTPVWSPDPSDSSRVIGAAYPADQTQPFIRTTLIAIDLPEPPAAPSYDYDFIVPADLWDFFPSALGELNSTSQFLLVSTRAQGLQALSRGKAPSLLDMDLRFASFIQDLRRRQPDALPGALRIHGLVNQTGGFSQQFYAFRLPEANPVLRETLNRRITRLLSSGNARSFGARLLPILFGQEQAEGIEWESPDIFEPYY